MKTLYVGFKGTSSELILKKLDDEDNDKAFLKNERMFDMRFLSNLLFDKKYEKIIVFGQKPIMNNKIAVEEVAFGKGYMLPSNYNLKHLYSVLDKNLINYKKSISPGSTNCNTIYTFLLKYVQENDLDSEVVFIHVPYLSKFPGLDKFVEIIKEF